jgi:hypothetical protein
MLSRFWLFLAFVAAFGATKAHVEGAPELLAVAVDQATAAKLPPVVSTVVLGDPMIADVTMLKTRAAMAVTGRGCRQTNRIAVDSEGGPRLEARFLQKGASQVSYPCNPDCMPTVQLGDDPKRFKDAGGGISSHNSYAMGGFGGGM